MKQARNTEEIITNYNNSKISQKKPTMPTCHYCHKATNSTYRNSLISDRNLNLINCCHQCAKAHNHLTISSIWQPKPSTSKDLTT